MIRLLRRLLGLDGEPYIGELSNGDIERMGDT
jgi:hypothetical protein